MKLFHVVSSYEHINHLVDLSFGAVWALLSLSSFARVPARDRIDVTRQCVSAAAKACVRREDVAAR